MQQPAQDSGLYASLLNSTFSDITLRTWNQLWWEYLYCGNWQMLRNRAFPSFHRELAVVKHGIHLTSPPNSAEPLFVQWLNWEWKLFCIWKQNYTTVKAAEAEFNSSWTLGPAIGELEHLTTLPVPPFFHLYCGRTRLWCLRSLLNRDSL